MSYVRSRTPIKFSLLDRSLVPCIIEVETRHSEVDTALRHRQPKETLTLRLTQKDICDPHLQHIMLLGISPTSFKNLKPKPLSLNSNGINN